MFFPASLIGSEAETKSIEQLQDSGVRLNAELVDFQSERNENKAPFGDDLSNFLWLWLRRRLCAHQWSMHYYSFMMGLQMRGCGTKQFWNRTLPYLKGCCTSKSDFSMEPTAWFAKDHYLFSKPVIIFFPCLFFKRQALGCTPPFPYLHFNFKLHPHFKHFFSN